MRLIPLILIFISTTAFAQINQDFKKKSLIVIVIDSLHNESIPFASIMVNDAQEFISDYDGLFDIKYAPDSLLNLYVSTIGYYRKTILDYKPTSDTLKIMMNQSPYTTDHDFIFETIEPLKK